MKKWSRTLLAGSALILLTNAVVLLGAAYNRSDEPESRLQLSQREFQHDRWSNFKDNSAITLTLNWRIVREKPSQQHDYDFDSGYSAGKWGTPVWLNKAKMAELGFDVAKLAATSENGRHYKESLSREALLVLELNDQAYQHELKRARDYAEQSRALLATNPDKQEFKQRAKNAEEYYKNEQKINSRLFVIDAGIDIQKLRTAYPDRTRYAIVHGLIHPGTMHEKNETQVWGNISELHAERINVPLNYRQVFDTVAPYEVTVAFGKRLEPWITAASRSAAAK